MFSYHSIIRSVGKILSAITMNHLINKLTCTDFKPVSFSDHLIYYIKLKSHNTHLTYPLAAHTLYTCAAHAHTNIHVYAHYTTHILYTHTVSMCVCVE